MVRYTVYINSPVGQFEVYVGEASGNLEAAAKAFTKVANGGHAEHEDILLDDADAVVMTVNQHRQVVTQAMKFTATERGVASAIDFEFTARALY